MPFVLIPTTLGTCALSWRGGVVTGFQLPSADDASTLARLRGAEGEGAPDPSPPGWITAVVARVQRHLKGDLQDFSDVPLAWDQVGAFEREVYRHAQRIPAGSTRSYGEIAGLTGAGPAGARAAGTALGANPWPLVVPCHRVVSADGKMTGFSAPGGIRTKTRLLAIEGAELLSE